MKKVIAILALVGFAFVGMADEIKGKGVCAKCSLKDGSKKCQAVIQVEKDGTTTNYYVDRKSAAHKALHSAICKKDVAGISVTGDVSEKDGKRVIVASSADIP